MDATDLENAPFGFAGQRHQLLDLYGEGLPAVVTNAGGAWYVKRNLGGGRFGPLEAARHPAHPTRRRRTSSATSIATATPTCRCAAGSRASTTFARASARWQPFRPFAEAPQVEALGGRAQWVDLNGDGRADVVVAGTTTLTWYPSGGDGFGPRSKLRGSGDRRNAVGHAPEMLDFLADMTGDGLADQVRVRTAGWSTGRHSATASSATW